MSLVCLSAEYRQMESAGHYKQLYGVQHCRAPQLLQRQFGSFSHCLTRGCLFKRGNFLLCQFRLCQLPVQFNQLPSKSTLQYGISEPNLSRLWGSKTVEIMLAFNVTCLEYISVQTDGQIDSRQAD